MSQDKTKRIPKYRKHKRSGNALVVLNGREIYLGIHDSAASVEKYNRVVAEWLLNGSLSCDSQQEITVAEVMAAYVAYAKTYYRKNGKVTREVGLVIEACRAVKPLYGRAKAVEFGPLALKAVRRYLVDKGISREHVNRQIGRVKRMFKWAAAEELVPADTSQALYLVAGLRRGRTDAPETAPILPVDDSIVYATLKYMPDVVADMVLFQRHTGCRPIEVCMLRPCDIDRSLDVWIYVPESHKTEHHGRKRIIPIGPKAQDILLRYLARDSEMNCFRPRDSEKKRLAERNAARKTSLSCGNVPGSNRKRRPKRTPGKQYSTGSYRKAIHRACDKAFPHPVLSTLEAGDMTALQQKELHQWQKDHRWSPNRMRHTAATEIRSEFGLEAAQIVLGHATADVTQIYAERDLAKGLEVARQIG